jgi:hypothetical protein
MRRQGCEEEAGCRREGGCGKGSMWRRRQGWEEKTGKGKRGHGVKEMAKFRRGGNMWKTS